MMESSLANAFFTGQPVLVTGAAGLIGSHLVAKLLSLNAVVRAIIHRAKPNFTNPRIEYLECDLTRPEDCARAVRGMKYVFHCAAGTSGAAVTATQPLAHFNANLAMNVQMLTASYAAQVTKFLWLGSTTAYPPTDLPVNEEDILTGAPFHKYFIVGWEKRFMEVLSRIYGEKLSPPMTVIVLRPTNVYGPNDNFDAVSSRVVAALIRKVVERRDPIEVWGDGEDVRDYIFVNDLADAACRAMEKIDSYTTLNVGSGRGYSVKDILNMILTIDGYANARVKFDPSKPSMIPIRLVQTSKAQSLLGCLSPMPLREGLRQTIEWFKTNQ